MTDGFQNTVDWIIRKDTEFPGEPPRAPDQPRNIRIRRNFFLSPSWRPKISVFGQRTSLADNINSGVRHIPDRYDVDPS